jgi:hypothetical protein
VAGIAHRFDFPGDAGGAFGFDVLAPECAHGLDELAGRVHLDVFAFAEGIPAVGSQFETAPCRPVRVDLQTELVLAADPAVGDGFPEPLRGGLDVDFEDLFHGTFQSGFEVAEGSGPWFCVLADPAVVDQADGHRIQEVEFFAAPTAGDHQAGFLQLLEVLHDPVAGHVEARPERVQGLPVLPEELVEQVPAGGVGDRPA